MRADDNLIPVECIAIIFTIRNSFRNEKFTRRLLNGIIPPYYYILATGRTLFVKTPIAYGPDLSRKA